MELNFTNLEYSLTVGSNRLLDRYVPEFVDFVIKFENQLKEFLKNKTNFSMLPSTENCLEVEIPPEFFSDAPPPVFDTEKSVLSVVDSEKCIDYPADILDARNIPWDERIHSSTKKMNQNGSWRYKKGADPDLIKIIEGKTTVVHLPVELREETCVPVDSKITAKELFERIMQHRKEKRISNNQILEILSTYGLTSIPQLYTSQAAEYLDAIAQEIEEFAGM